jgi:hypothetical protein
MKTIRYAPSQEGMLARNRFGMLGLVLGGEFVPLPISGGAFGTLSTLDTLASIRQSVIEFGEDRAWESISIALAAHNAQVEEMLGDLVEKTTDARRAYGTSDAKTMQELDQWGQGDAQKISAGVAIDFPLRRYGDSLQWTRQWMMSNSVQQLAAEVAAVMDADRLNFQRQVKRAIYGPTNTTFIDKLGRTANISLNIKAFLNADGAAIPVGPNGEVFNGASHTHYLATASLTAANLAALILTVQEHVNTGIPEVYINSADEAAVRALTGFVPAMDPRLIVATTVTLPTQRLDVSNLYNRMIGYFGAAEIWIKPWILASYFVATVDGQPPPLVMRTPTFGGLDQLSLMAEDERYPLRARTYERQFGIAPWQRAGLGVLYTGGGAYVSPSIP